MTSEEFQAAWEREKRIRRRFRAASLATLVTGLLLAVAVFFHPPPNRERRAIGFEDMGGRSFPIYQESSKRYQVAAESTLGKGGMLLTDVREGFINLWHGRRLAYTVAGLAIAVSYSLFYLSDLFGYPPGQAGRGGRDDATRGR